MNSQDIKVFRDKFIEQMKSQTARSIEAINAKPWPDEMKAECIAGVMALESRELSRYDAKVEKAIMVKLVPGQASQGGPGGRRDKMDEEAKAKEFTVKVTVHGTWIEDGFGADNFKELEETLIAYAHDGEVIVKIVSEREVSDLEYERQLEEHWKD
jgi:hypothetical protein